MEDKTPAHKVMHSFEMNPHVNFEGQAVGEVVILLLRAHPITQISWILSSIFLMIIALTLNLVYPLFLSVQQIIYANLFFLVIIFGYIWFNFLTWYFNAGIVTNHRIVDIDFTNILYKEVSATRLDKIEDVSAKMGGYFKSLFNYGDVYIQTAGTEENIEFIGVPFPTRVAQIINELMT